MAVKTVADYFARTKDDDDVTWPFKLDKARRFDENRITTGVKLANLRISEAALQNPKQKSMGTTIVAILFRKDIVYIAHVGDSRVYVLRGAQLNQITNDHSWVEEQVRAGTMSPTAARQHPWRNVVTRALSGGEDPEVDVTQIRPIESERYLLCSDGLTDMVETEVVHGVVDGQRTTLEVAASQLIELANQNGGRDNISVILAHVPEAFLPGDTWAERYLARKRHS